MNEQTVPVTVSPKTSRIVSLLILLFVVAITALDLTILPEYTQASLLCVALGVFASWWNARLLKHACNGYDWMLVFIIYGASLGHLTLAVIAPRKMLHTGLDNHVEIYISWTKITVMYFSSLVFPTAVAIWESITKSFNRM
jgi:hypothetical protein